MKKGFVLFISIIFVAFTGFMPVKADNDITIGGSSYIDDYITNDEYKHINYSGLLAEYLRQGGTVDIGNMDTSSNDLASDIINSFGNFAVDVLRETGNFIDWIGHDQVFQEDLVVNRNPVAWKPALRNNVWQLIGQLPFMYLNTDDGDTPVPTPDINYATYIDTINGNGFYFKEYPITNFASYGTVNFGPNYDYSFCATNIQYSDGFNGNFPQMFVSDIISINIISDGDYYKIDQTISFIQPLGTRNNANMYYYAPYKNVTGDKYYVLFDGNHPADLRYQFTGTLQGCFQYLAYKFRNINIYVNGDLWAYVGNSNSYNIQLGTGTVVPTTNGRVEWKYDDEIYIDIDLIWQLLDRFINDPNRTTTIIDFGVIEDCIVDANGQTAIAVKVIQDDPLSIDDQLVLDYGTLIPVFPVAVDYPIDVRDTARIAVIGVQVLPSDIIEIVILGIFGMLFVCFVHRGLE